jgi:hypothetical protein
MDVSLISSMIVSAHQILDWNLLWMNTLAYLIPRLFEIYYAKSAINHIWDEKELEIAFQNSFLYSRKKIYYEISLN